MKYRKLNNNDYSFGNNFNDFIEGDEAVKQAVLTKLKLLQGEWWEDVTLGFPLFQKIIGKVNNDVIKNSLQKFISESIMSIEEIRDFKIKDVIRIDRDTSILLEINLKNDNSIEMEVEL